MFVGIWTTTDCSCIVVLDKRACEKESKMLDRLTGAMIAITVVLASLSVALALNSKQGPQGQGPDGVEQAF